MATLRNRARQAHRCLRHHRLTQVDPKNASYPPKGGYDAAGHVAARVQTGDGPAGVAHASQYLYHDSGQAAAAASDLTAATSNPAAAGAWTFGYDHAGRLTSQTDPNGESSALAYNPDNTLAGKTVTAAAATIAAWAYQYNNNQQITTQTVTEAGSSTLANCTPAQPAGPCAGAYNYTYDAANRLASFADAGGTRTVSYDHDSNRTNYGAPSDTYTPQPGQPKTLQLAYNPDDSIAQTVAGTATQTLTYNPNGDLASDGCNTYTQDGFDRTAQVANPGHPGCGPAATVAYSYDGLDRQRSHTDTAPNTAAVTTNISYDGLNTTVASETPAGATNLAANYALSPNGHPLAVNAAPTISGAQELTTDGSATVALTTGNTAPAVDCTARFDPYGTPQYAQPGDPQHVCNTGATPNDVFYNGARHDATSGTYQFGSRTYDPTKAAFLTPDTYRAAPPQANLSIGVDPLTRDTYNYLNGDPVNQTDLDGHGFCLAGHNPNGSCRGATEARQAAATVGGAVVGAVITAGADIACGGPEDLPCDPAAVAAGIDASGAAGDAISQQIDPSSDVPTTTPKPPTNGATEPPTGPTEPPSSGPPQPPSSPTEPPSNSAPSGQAPSSSSPADNPTGPTNTPASNADVQAEATARAQVHAEMVQGQDAGVANTTAPSSGTTAAETEDAGASLSGRIQTDSSFGDKAIQNALKVPGEEGYFDVVGHGTPSDVSGLSPSDLGDRIEGTPGFEGQNVRLLSCSTGCPSGTFAQDLADRLGVTVQAPTTDFYVSSRGGITFDPGGEWAFFSPGG